MKKIEGSDRTPRDAPRDWGESSARGQFRDPSAAVAAPVSSSSYGQRFTQKDDVEWYTCFLQGN